MAERQATAWLFRSTPFRMNLQTANARRFDLFSLNFIPQPSGFGQKQTKTRL
jgi:hypothetical protein